MIRTGIGYDIHRLVDGRPLIIGGVEVPHQRGLAGHSDADVLLHAIMDALLGAVALPDIGNLFPDTDPAYKDADSAGLLKEVWARVSGEGWYLANLDCIIIAEAPKFATHIPVMRERIAEVISVEPGQIGVKATSNEELGYIGAGEAIAAWCVCLLEK
ncbi:MAG: 2-C-methyl-D-erythritol 2,4-cyclodiphosphate synthase [bacterium]|nr:2-C-methyl-D-erythritol 2,4-cyclodiphosphate synthase [bacterium]